MASFAYPIYWASSPPAPAPQVCLTLTKVVSKVRCLLLAAAALAGRRVAPAAAAPDGCAWPQRIAVQGLGLQQKQPQGAGWGRVGRSCNRRAQPAQCLGHHVPNSADINQKVSQPDLQI